VLSVLACVAGSFGIPTAGHAQTETISIEVRDGRPVAEAIRTLTSQYPIVITYEDPPYRYSADIRDVTEEVRGPAARASTNRILVPNGGTLHFSYEAIVDTDGRPANVRNTLQAILNANAASSHPGRFRIEQAGDVFHVIPTQVRNERGDWITQTSVLDTRITLPRQETDGHQMLEAITDAVTEATGIHIGLGLGSPNPYFRYSGYLEADNEAARDVLLRTLHAIDYRFTWRLLYGPDLQSYGLNLRTVEAPPKLPERLDRPPADSEQPPAFGPRERER
jgi:hypothetical protein